jgi:hypothetical protein
VPFIYSAEAVQALREECQRAMPRLHDQKAQRLLQSLVITADVAIQGGGELIIYRFGSSDTPQPRLQNEILVSLDGEITILWKIIMILILLSTLGGCRNHKILRAIIPKNL